MRLCIIGNSHVSALKKACNEGLWKPEPGTSVTFFGSPMQSLKKLYPEQMQLTTKDQNLKHNIAITSGLPSGTIDPEQFDVFLLHSLIRSTQALTDSLRLARFANAGGPYLTSGFFGAVIREWFDDSTLKHVAVALREVTDKPAFATVQPMISVGVLNHSQRSQQFVGWQELALHSRPNPLKLFHEVIRRELDAHGIELIQQNPKTLVHGLFTDHAFCTGSVRLTAALDANHPDDDFDHMNYEYGALVLEEVLERATARAS